MSRKQAYVWKFEMDPKFLVSSHFMLLLPTALDGGWLLVTPSLPYKFKVKLLRETHSFSGARCC